jgi:hypothetical protein
MLTRDELYFLLACLDCADDEGYPPFNFGTVVPNEENLPRYGADLRAKLCELIGRAGDP